MASHRIRSSILNTGCRHRSKNCSQVIGDSAASPRYIETLPRRGYRFVGPVEYFRTDRLPMFRRQRRSQTHDARCSLLLWFCFSRCWRSVPEV